MHTSLQTKGVFWRSSRWSTPSTQWSSSQVIVQAVIPVTRCQYWTVWDSMVGALQEAGLCRVCQSDKARGTTNRNWEKSGFLRLALSENSPTSFVGKLFSHKSRGRILRRGFVGEFSHKSLSEKPFQRKKSCKEEKVENLFFKLEKVLKTKVAWAASPLSLSIFWAKKKIILLGFGAFGPKPKENYLFFLPKRCLALRFTTDCKEAVSAS